jgi:hypothetical protein
MARFTELKWAARGHPGSRVVNFTRTGENVSPRCSANWH